MKNKTPCLPAVALAAAVVLGCQRQSDSNPPPAENPPSAPANTNSPASTNLGAAKPPAVPSANGANIPASTNR